MDPKAILSSDKLLRIKIKVSKPNEPSSQKHRITNAIT